MIDDLQFIGGKDATQEEFFHTVNEFMSSGKRLVIAADRAPQALEGFEPRLAGRLGSGLVADIKPAELELRRAIVARKLEDMPAVDMPEEVVDLLAARITSNVRELEGALNRLVAYANLSNETITIDFAVTTLGEVLRNAQRRITIDEIQRAVSSHFEVKQIDLISERRAVAIARPRQPRACRPERWRWAESRSAVAAASSARSTTVARSPDGLRCRNNARARSILSRVSPLMSSAGFMPARST